MTKMPHPCKVTPHPFLLRRTAILFFGGEGGQTKMSWRSPLTSQYSR